MRKTSFSLIVGGFLAILVSLSLTLAYPNVQDLWGSNRVWNGLSEVYSDYQPIRLSSYSELGSIEGESTLFIIGPGKSYTTSDADYLREYLEGGGNIVLADESGTGNQLLLLLGIDAEFNLGLLKDPLFREKNSLMPIASVSGLHGVENIVLNIPTSIRIENTLVYGWSSPVSYMARNLDEEGESYASFPVLGRVEYLGGVVWVLSDSSVFINSMLELGDNRRFLEALTYGDMVIDETHASNSILTVIQEKITVAQSLFNILEIRYLFVLILGSLLYLTRLRLHSEPVAEVDALLKSHPEFDRDRLIWLSEKRREAREEI